MSETIAPESVHIALAVITVLAWLVNRFVVGKADAVDVSVPAIKYGQLAIAAATAVGFTLFLHYAFTARHMVGYVLEERWEWLDNAYVYRAVYGGEYAGAAYLYLTPLVLPFIVSFFLAPSVKPVFIKLWFRRYPLVIILAYVFAAVTLAGLGVNLQRAETYPTEELSEAPGEWRK